MENKGFYTNTSQVRFLDKIIDDLNACSEFDFSVSFIKKAGLVLLQDHIEKALERGVKARLITSTYQNFTDIPSLEIFLNWKKRFSNFECHLDYNCFGEDGFHTKGYIFTIEGKKEVIVGSSNITRFALLKNKEWDVSVSTDDTEPFFKEVEAEFNDLWKHTAQLDQNIIKRYQSHLAYAIQSWDMDYFDPEANHQIKPNMMQRQALKEIKMCRNRGINKALVVSATGSGKTYLAAFDALNFDSKRLLFIVHKDMILNEALKTFAKVFGTKRQYGIYTGERKDLDADFLFATNQMMAKHLDLFDKNEFDYIVIDEVHHSAASTYQKIINHFQPEFLLGLTATPDRMDGQDVYDLFGNNVPYDLRLREAMENDLIVPFKYYGIKDSLISYADDSVDGIRKCIQQIASTTHCEFVRDQIEKYRPKGTKLKCVGFCRNQEHARLMAAEMSNLGYQTAWLSSLNTTGERIKVLNDLQDENSPLEIVFAIDILNEGIDVPAMNMVLFLRPTESSTIFIQQLGRGLRKYKDKEYLTVLDFIANSYERSSQIAMALGSLSKSGSLDKNAAASYVRTSFESIGIDGLEIHFDRESMDEILKSIEMTNFNSIKLLKQDFSSFKEFLKLGPSENPVPTDFLNDELGIDFLRFAKIYDSYYDFLLKCNADVPTFTEEQVNVYRTLTWFLPLVRNTEFWVISQLLESPKTFEELNQEYQKDTYYSEKALIHSLKMLLGEISLNKKSYFHNLIKFHDNKYELNFELNSLFKPWVEDLLLYGIEKFEGMYTNQIGDLKLYGKYNSIQSTLLAMCNEKTLINQLGPFYQKDFGLCIYVNLKKDALKEERLKYKDKFISKKVMQWESQTGTTLENKKGRDLINAKQAHIFARKMKKEDGLDVPYIYLGKGTLTNPRPSDNTAKSILFDIILEKEVPEEYKYDFGIVDTD